MNKRLFIALTIVILAIASGELKSQLQNFDHSDSTRQYIFYAPSNLQAKAPLVFVLHGYTGSALSIQNYSAMNVIADEYGFAVCYPQGTIDHRGNHFWNVGYDFHPGVSTDDVNFLVQLAQHLQNEYNLSPENTYATGMSNGGEMCYLLACEASCTFSAVAPVAGMMLQKIFNNCKAKRAIPVFEIHGTSDEINRFEGDINGDDGWGAYPDIPSTINYWVRVNACTASLTDTLSNLNTTDNSFVISEKHINVKNGNEVWLYKVVNGGHDWPGSSGNMDINSSREVWLFFKNFITN